MGMSRVRVGRTALEGVATSDWLQVQARNIKKDRLLKRR